MAVDMRRARRALRAAGVGASALPSSWWPIGRTKRLLSLVRRRRAVLETKNNIVDFLFRSQHALADLRLRRIEDVHVALKDPERTRLMRTVGASQEMLEEELRSRYGSEGGQVLGDALSELVAEGVVIRVPGKALLSNYDVFLAAHGRERPHYDIAELTSLLHEGSEYGARLRARVRSEASSGGSRTYDM